MPIAAVVADANVLLSAIIGKAALKVFDKDALPWARAILGERDPDDAHPLALSRVLDLPLWSNDRDLQIPGIRCYTTAALLKVLTG